ncbi:MAG: DegT/DnrJ/EryC1/StrS aminotransferase family protein, partial [Firmicutes bacterium]|nr:DegT/DnrJ/EryC1/StrS aminotransferase family protein [Bacillota bacterium]
MKKMNIPFSPPDISDAEIEQVVAALKSGWITTGPKTKQLEKEIAEFLGTNRAACLNSSTAAMEMTLRLLEIGPGDEVIVPAYTYTATCSVVCHVGATPVIVDTQKDIPEIDYDKLEDVITEKTKVIMPVDLAGIPCDYDKLYEVLENVKEKYTPAAGTLQEKFGRIVVLADSSHGFGAEKGDKKAGQLADFT